MLSIEKCRKVLNQNIQNFTDEQITQIREFLYQLSNIDFQNYKNLKDEETCRDLYKGKHS
ncbi:MAG: hypothetical protein NVSMB67_31030 [Flavisolibacter sp.]